MDGPYHNYCMYGLFIHEWSQTKLSMHDLKPKILWIAMNKKYWCPLKKLMGGSKQKVLYIARNEWPTKEIKDGPKLTTQ